MPQQRLVIVMASERKTYESDPVELSEDAEREFKKTINEAKRDGGKISSVDLKPPKP